MNEEQLYAMRHSLAHITAAAPSFSAEANKKPLQAQGLTAVCWEVRLRCPDL